MKLVLASQSPRRKEILSRAGYEFSVRVANADETLLPGLSPKEQVVRLSGRKAQAVAEALSFPEDTVILSADTVVVLEEEILGKPCNEEDAARMLRSLSGRSHLVLTGITLRCGQRILSHCEETEVRFRTLSEEEISRYIATGEPMDKAGAYGIQGYAGLFVTGISGDYYNVMGLPLCAAALRLRDFGIPMLEATV